MGYRSDNYGRGQALQGDRTTTGAICCTSLPNCSEHGRGVIRVGDKTTRCLKCGKPGIIVDGEPRVIWEGIASAVDRSVVICGCPPGTNRVIAPAGQWIGQGPSPEQIAREKHLAMLAARQVEKAAEEKKLAEELDGNRVFVKSCLRGEGCNDAGEQREPHGNFAEMAFFQAAPAADPASDSGIPQHAQTAKKKKPDEDIPKPKKRSDLHKWWFGNHEEMDYQAASAAAISVARAQTATAGASVLEPIAGSIAVRGTWAVRAAGVAAGGVGAPLAGLLVGMMPGRLNDGEQDFIDRMRLEQMQEAPTRARFNWENDSSGNPVPRGWHTPPGKDRVRVRKMTWDDVRQAYTFTTEEDDPVTLVWTPDSSGVKVPANTGNQTPPRLPGSVMVDPLPDNTGIESTTSPAPEEKEFADYILILPLPDIPPIYIYLSKPPVKFLEVDLYSNLEGRSRDGIYHADHMPSRAAFKLAMKKANPDIFPRQLEALSQIVAAIIIPKEVHQMLSETYGGRNTDAQIKLDASNLRAAVDRNLDAIKSALKEHGATETEIEEARTKIHKLNSEVGIYK